jgi:HSP20 family protein
MTLVKRKNERSNGNGGFFPSLRNDPFFNRFLSSRPFDFDNDFWDRGIEAPLANFSETNKEFKLELSAPGLKREDFKIDIDNGMLTISSEKEEEKKEDDKNYHRREFSYNSFCRTFPLPDNVDENNINARYDNGMLQLTIPKKETAVNKPKKQIQVS